MVSGTSAPPRFIDPKTLAALGDLTLAARTVVDGFMYGVHQSRMPGAGLEFSQYRSYQPGDDLRRVDWKLFARSDRYFLRDAETDTSVAVRLVLDASESMAQEEAGLSKLDYARMTVAALALLAHRQGDAVGLYPVAGPPGPVEPPRRQHQHLDRLLHALARLTPAGSWPAWETLEGVFTAGGQRGIVVIVTDLHERAAEIRTVATKLAALRHDVLLIHVASRTELELSFKGVVTLEELETGRRIEVDADAARPAYLAAMERDLTLLRRALEDQRVDYVRFRLDQPLDAALRRYLTIRTRRR
jgi:uncharacterized protein (DUF58 family)